MYFIVQTKKGISIKFSLIAIIGIMVVVMMAVSFSYFLTIRKLTRDAQRMSNANELSDQILVALGWQALERGVTAMELAMEGRTGRMFTDKGTEKISRLRAHGDEAFDKARALANSIVLADSTNKELASKELANKELEAALLALDNSRRAVLSARGRVDSYVATGIAGITPDQFHHIMTEFIEAGATIRMAAFSSQMSTKTLLEPLRMNLVLKQAAWLASENSGRESSIVGFHINANKPISPAVLEKLKVYRGITEINIATIMATFKNLDSRYYFAHNRLLDMEDTFMGSFQRVREDLYAEAATSAYSISGARWFEVSTEAINTINAVSIAVSEVVSEIINAEIVKLKTQIFIAGIFFVISVLLGLVAFFVISRKVLKPMNDLSVIADLVGLMQKTNDLTLRIKINSKDEIGEFAEILNKMIDELERSRTQIQYDIDSRKHAEGLQLKSNAELALLNLNLERKVTELDEFTYMASHDLQEPLRKLHSFSDLLKLDIGDDLSERAAKDLHYIQDSAGRMHVLIKELLALSRAGREKMNSEWLSLSDCVEAALKNLELTIAENDVLIIRDDSLPKLNGDKMMLTQLYQNLISNAIKFVQKQQPIITITCTNEGAKTVLGVKDNGIGVKLEYSEQIFAPFKRLHGKGDFKGSGIGLSICKKMVERHGGMIWVDSNGRDGAHFKFTLTS